MDKGQPYEQANFKSDYAVIDHLQIVKQLIERPKPLCLTFIDYSEVFDCKICKIITESINRNNIKMNRNIHNNNNSLILSHERQKKKTIGKEVGMISPELHSGEVIFSIGLFMHIK